MEGKSLKPTTEKILKSGIIDKHMAELMEHWGILPDGASKLAEIGEEKLRTATRGQLEKMAEEIGDTVTNELLLRETRLDLDNVRWPVSGLYVNAYNKGLIAGDLSAVIDRMSRYLFRIQDVDPGWFVPGYELNHRHLLNGRTEELIKEEILESQVLYVGETPVAVQVSVRPAQ